MIRSVPGRSKTALIAALLVALAACSRQTPEELIAAAQRHLSEGNARAAEIELRNAIQLAPTSSKAHRLLGTELARFGDPVTAEALLRKSITLGESGDDVTPMVALAVLRQGHAQRVIDEFGAIGLQDRAANASLRATVGEAWLLKGQVKEASGAFAAALAAQPGHPAGLLGQARIAAHEGRLDAALVLVESALETDPRFAEGHAFKGQLLLGLGQRDAATQALEQSLAIDASYMPPRLTLAALLIEAKDYQKAQRLLSVGEPASKDLRVLYLQGVLALRQGALPKAREFTAAALKQSPEHGPTLALAGEVELRAGNLQAAELHLGKALKLQPSPTVQGMLATTYLRQNKPGKAIEVLQSLLRAPGPKDANLLMLAGEAYLANGDVRRAGEYFEEVKSAGSHEGTVQTRLGQVALARGDFERSAQDLQAASTLSPQKAEPDLLLFSVHQRRNEPAKALAAAQAFIKKQPQNPLGHVLAGAAREMRGDRAGARTSLDEALRIAPTHVPALRALARLDAAEGRSAQALQRYEDLLANNPDDDQLLVAAAECQEMAGRSEEAGKTLRKAVAANPKAQAPVVALVGYHLRRKDAAAALAVAREAVMRNPEEQSLAVLLSVAQEAAGADKEAIRTLSALMLQEPQAVGPAVRLAHIQARQRDFDGAVVTLLRAQAKMPDSEDVARELVAVYLKSGKADQALNVAKSLGAGRAGWAVGHLLEGDVHVHSKKWSEAERAYRAALQVDPRNTVAASKIQAVLQAAGKKKEADDFAADWITRVPTDVAMRLLVADSALRSGNLPLAIRQYEEALRLRPNMPLALNNLAWALGQTKDPKALDAAERAALLAPNNPDVLDTLGVLYLDGGDTKKGLEALQRVRDLAPDRPDLRLRYAKGLLKSGRTQEGKAELRDLAALKVDFPGKSEIPALLATL